MKLLDILAEENSYKDRTQLLMDYSLIPTVKLPKHKKHEFITLLRKHLKKTNK